MLSSSGTTAHIVVSMWIGFMVSKAFGNQLEPLGKWRDVAEIAITLGAVLLFMWLTGVKLTGENP